MKARHNGPRPYQARGGVRSRTLRTGTEAFSSCVPNGPGAEHLLWAVEFCRESRPADR